MQKPSGRVRTVYITTEGVASQGTVWCKLHKTHKTCVHGDSVVNANSFGCGKCIVVLMGLKYLEDKPLPELNYLLEK